jgi:hypothetical protein
MELAGLEPATSRVRSTHPPSYSAHRPFHNRKAATVSSLPV